jgi:thiamine biosynthesis protein ThiI
VEYELIIVRYGEIALKSKTTRRHFENCLISNIKNALNREQIKHRIKKEWGRIYVYTTHINKGIDVLRKIFGIVSVSPTVQTQSNIDSMSSLAVNISKDILNEEKTFAISVTRTGNHKYTSQDVAIELGNDLVKATKASVDLTKPDFKLFIEIRDQSAYIFTEKIRGTGGLPLGTQGKLLALIDGSDSILAAWCIMRRGCTTIFVNINKHITGTLNSFMTNWYAESEVTMIDPKQPSIYENLNKIASERSCDAVVTGHTICEDSQNELSDIKLMKKHIKLPILHPLIAKEKEDINKKCKEIGMPT